MEKLFADFSPSTKDELLQKIEKELKGKPFQNLVFPTYEGIHIQPVYTKEDLQNIPSYQIPQTSSNWQTVSEIVIQNLKKTQENAQLALKEGAGLISFKLDNSSEKDISSLLKDFASNQVELNLPLSELQKNASILEQEVRISLDFVSENLLYKTWGTKLWDDLANAFKANSNISLFLNTQNFPEAGANAVQELAFSLALAVETIDQLTERGIELETLFARLKFSFGISNNYFMEISKIRAFRVLWAKVVESFEQLTSKNYSKNVFIHCKTASWNKPKADIYNNMIRLSTESMSAVLGGCDALTISPYNLDNSDTFARRISLNISNLLREESYFDKVKSIPEGSYYLDNLLHELLQNAWKLFQKVEAKGGFQKAFNEGFIPQEIQNIAQQRLENLSSEKDVVVGLNKYQNPKEENPQNTIEFLTLGSK